MYSIFANEQINHIKWRYHKEIIKLNILIYEKDRIYFSSNHLRGVYGCMWSRSSSTEVKDNVLTEEEKAEGYTLLFNGKDFTGWKMFNGGDVKGWQVEDGVIVGYGNGGDVIADTTIKVSTDIVTVKNYHNFQIKWDWKIGAQGNSGFLYHVQEGPKYKAPFETGPEYQLIDDDNYPWVSETGKEGLEDWQKTGCNYAMYVPETKQVNPPGEWNSSMVLYKDGYVEHWLNGEKLVSFQEGSEDWKMRRYSGKWEAFPDYGISTTGKLCFQDHGSKVYFKNVKIKDLD